VKGRIARFKKKRPTKRKPERVKKVQVARSTRSRVIRERRGRKEAILRKNNKTVFIFGDRVRMQMVSCWVGIDS